MGLPLGSWIMRNETASSVDTAGQSLTGMRTRERRRLPDQSEGGGIDTNSKHCDESESGVRPGSRKGNKWGLAMFRLRPRDEGASRRGQGADDGRGAQDRSQYREAAQSPKAMKPDY